jgi:fatty-acyl-CoA synthase
MAHVGKVGRPAPGVRVRLLDAEGVEVPDGQVGEIVVAGDNVMRGYHREPGHPSFREGWFRSGDLGRRDAQGRYEVVGRLKEMIISGGENIYPAEIENLVAALPGLREFAVVGLPDPLWGEIVVLAAVREAGADLQEADVRHALEGRLARYKHPKRIVFLESLPKTALGKVRKPELAVLLQSR